METTESEEQKSDMRLNDMAQTALKTSANWARFTGIVGLIGMILLVVILIISSFNSNSGGSNALIRLIIYIVPILAFVCLIQYSLKAKKALKTKDEEHISDAIVYMQNFVVLVGIMVVFGFFFLLNLFGIF